MGCKLTSFKHSCLHDFRLSCFTAADDDDVDGCTGFSFWSASDIVDDADDDVDDDARCGFKLNLLFRESGLID